MEELCRQQYTCWQEDNEINEFMDLYDRTKDAIHNGLPPKTINDELQKQVIHNGLPTNVICNGLQINVIHNGLIQTSLITSRRQ